MRNTRIQIGTTIFNTAGIRYIQCTPVYRISGKKDYTIDIAYKGDKIILRFDTEEERAEAFKILRAILLENKKDKGVYEGQRGD